MQIVDPEQVIRLIEQVTAAVILPRFQALGPGQVREKNPGDLVTVADTEAETLLAAGLQALLQGTSVVGEEQVAADAAALAPLAGAAPVWIIDPIDGTANFVKGLPQFAVIVALVQDQRTRQGWIHDPLSRRSWHTSLGGGSWCDGRRLTLAGERPAVLTGVSAWRDKPRLERAGLQRRQSGSAAHDYLALLDGRLDFACYRRLQPWDHAAGVLLYQEAGGVAGLLDGGAYQPLPQDSALLLAPDKARWQTLHQLFAADS